MNEPVELVIFDCDGVLVDSEKLAVALVVQIGAQFGMEMTAQEAVHRYMGRSEGLFEQTLEEHLGRPLTSEERQRNESLVREAFESQLTAVEGVLDAIQAIPLMKCVASSSNPESLRWKLERCGLLGSFDGRVFSAAQVEHGKPAPDLFLLAASTLGVDPTACIVIEDSQYGLQAARAAGMRSLGYLTGMTPVEALAGPGTILFDDMAQLPELVSG